MKLKHLWKAAGLVALSAILILTLCLAGLLALVVRSAQITQFWNAPLTKLSQSLVLEEGRYHFTGEDLLAQQDLWLMLVGRDGQVLWQYNKPAEVPDQYDLLDVAAFTRWYLEDYPVQTRIRPDGLLVAGAPEGEHLEAPHLALGYGCAADHAACLVRGCCCSVWPCWGCWPWPPWCWAAGSGGTSRRGTVARSDWINGISHDIRTPSESMVMGYAGTAGGGLRPSRPGGRAQAAIIRRQSQTIRDLINDLNLTMRLDYAMQPLRRGSLHPAALVRQVAADVLNGGLEERYALAVEVPPEAEALTLEGDASLLRRALLNLVNNCVRHNPEGCSITLTAAAEGEVCTLRVEDDGGGGLPVGLAEVGLAPDGGAAHGTGLRLVEQIARAHGGALELHRAARGVLAVLRLPL